MVLILGLFRKGNSRRVQTQGEYLYSFLKHYGIKTSGASRFIHPLLRFVDYLYSIVFKNFNIGIIQFYGTRSIYFETVNVFLLRVLGKKVVLTLHGGAIPELYRHKKRLFDYCFRNAAAITCPSPFLLKWLKGAGYEGVEIKNIVDAREYKFHNKEQLRPRLLWMRAYEEAYNPKMVIAVAEILCKKYTDLRIVMYGPDHGLRAGIETLIVSKGLETIISCHGLADTSLKNKLAEECDIYICTNIIDNAPVSFVEMMLLGLPVVSSDPGGIRDYVQDEVNALISPVNNAEAMAESVIRLIEDNILAQRIIEGGKAFAGQFTPEAVLPKWKDLLQIEEGNQ